MLLKKDGECQDVVWKMEQEVLICLDFWLRLVPRVKQGQKESEGERELVEVKAGVVRARNGLVSGLERAGGRSEKCWTEYGEEQLLHCTGTFYKVLQY